MKTLSDPVAVDELARRLAAICPGTSRLWGKMNAHEMLCHLADAFELGLGARSATSATGLFQRTVMKWGALYFPVPWPKGVPTRPEMEQGVAGWALGATAPSDFETDREHLLNTLRRFAACPDFSRTLHPIFGVMTTAQWQRWGYLHTDHHFRQFGN